MSASTSVNMQTGMRSDISVKLCVFLLKNLGIWMCETTLEQYGRNLMIALTYIFLTVATIFQIRDLYFTWINDSDILYNITNSLSLWIGTVKVSIVLLHKVEFLNLIVYMREKFWTADYDAHEKNIVDKCRRTCIFFICCVTTVGMCVMALYIITPFLSQSQNNDTERRLPFNMWIKPLLMTPFYECMIVSQILILYYVGLCYFCFDNVFCLMAVHLAGQFRIVRYRLETLCDIDYYSHVDEKNPEQQLLRTVDRIYSKFKQCVRQHQALINFYESLQNVYTMIILVQVLMFSLLICLFGYQILLSPHATLGTRSIFALLVVGALSLLLMFTYSCDEVIEKSESIALGAYSAMWSILPMSQPGRLLRKDLITVIVRARRVCCLTANGFFPVSLETYTSILSTAASYFTLMRSNAEG
ncbi:odorant receptor 13a-like isoform X1 [Ceratina calcarata]|uniref:Odorant receptor n=1 Tax=Ceratina calcarata TaxID=156304 RepID=A0AAJ7JFF4_9HYME|nr:odorant receptor 13a-like isoform X1 [Ceratina calcarata]